MLVGSAKRLHHGASYPMREGYILLLNKTLPALRTVENLR